MVAKFDIFVSYKTRKYADQARQVVNSLSARGYRVWFDEEVLNSKGGLGKFYNKEELIGILTEAVKQCKCSVVFEAELEKVAVPLGFNIEQEYRKKTVMLTASGPIAWNWQKLEIDASSKSIAIHPSSRRVFVFDDSTEVSHKIGLPTEPYNNSLMLLQRILLILDYFVIAPSGQK